ncbi:3506_t:CDS:2, partial [Gigaspora rosea]
AKNLVEENKMILENILLAKGKSFFAPPTAGIKKSSIFCAIIEDTEEEEKE